VSKSDSDEEQARQAMERQTEFVEISLPTISTHLALTDAAEEILMAHVRSKRNTNSATRCSKIA
jgi:hypothetical protein